jgi:hypothetical protein
MYQAFGATVAWPLAGMVMRGSGANQCSELSAPCQKLRFQVRIVRSFVLTYR